MQSRFKTLKVAGFAFAAAMGAANLMAQGCKVEFREVKWQDGVSRKSEVWDCPSHPYLMVFDTVRPDAFEKLPRTEAPKVTHTIAQPTLNLTNAKANLVKEHNRARMHPGTIASEIKTEWNSKMNGASATTKQAYETAVASLTPNMWQSKAAEGAADYSKSLPALTEDAELSRRAQEWADKLATGTITNVHENVSARIAGYGGGGENIFVCDEETGVHAVRGFIVDDGDNNKGAYGHRKNIYNAGYKYIGVGLSSKGNLVVLFGVSKAGDMDASIKGTIVATANNWTLTTNTTSSFSFAYKTFSANGQAMGGGSGTAMSGKFTSPFPGTKGNKIVVKVFPTGSAAKYDDPKAYVIAEHTF